MQTHCSNCTGQLSKDDVSCPYCGSPVQSAHVQQSDTSSVIPVPLIQSQYCSDVVLSPKTNSMATASLVVSCVGWFFNLLGITPILGIILGMVSLNQIKKTGEEGRRSAIAAIIVSSVNLVVVFIAIVFLVYWITSISSTYSY